MKDALGHGSDPRGGAQAPAQPAQPAPTYQPGRFGRGPTNFNPSPWLDARHARQAKLIADRQAANALAQGHPKSGTPPIHSGSIFTRLARGVRSSFRNSDG